MALHGGVTRLLRDELVEARDLRDLVDGLAADCQALHPAIGLLEREAVGIGEDVDGLAPLDRVLGNQRRDAGLERDLELRGRVLHDGLDVLRRQRLKVDLGTARAQRRVDVAGVARRRADQHEVRRRALLEELADVGRDLRVRRIVVGRLEVGALVLEDLQ